MNSEITPPVPKLAAFPRLPESLLLNFGSIYMPDMGQAELKCCQKYYLRHRRAPQSTDELAFLNAFVARNYREPNSFLISEMKTDDDFLAATFADLMAKRAAVSPNYKMPCSFTEITKIAQKYLSSREKKHAETDTLDFSCTPNHALALAARKSFPALLDGNMQDGLSCGVGLSRAFSCHTPIAAGDKIYACLKSTDPTKNFEEKLLSFAASPSVISHAKKLCHVADRGILKALMDLDMGFEVELSRLYSKDDSAARLAQDDIGLLIVVKETEASDILMDALDMGLRPRLVGSLRKDEQILLRKDENTKLHFSLHFLGLLAFSRAYHTEMKPSAATPFALARAEEKTVTIDGKPLFLVRADTGDSRLAALYATLYAIAACVARGADLEDIGVAHRAHLCLNDTSPRNLGNQLALLLGFYRATVEFELTELDSSLLNSQDATDFTVYAAAHEPKNPTPARLVDTASQIYLLEPAYDAGGNPDFEDMKKMLEYIGKLRENGKILSAKAVVGDLLPTLEEMSQNSLVECLRDAPCIAKAGSILIETKQTIQGILLARTCQPEILAEESE